MVEIIGKPKLESKKTIKQITQDCLKKFEVADSKIIEICFVNPNVIQELNFVHRKINKPTDVLSFPQNNMGSHNKQILGSIVICEIIAEKLAEKDSDLVRHGFLHLLGYDHEIDVKKWNKAELKIR